MEDIVLEDFSQANQEHKVTSASNEPYSACVSMSDSTALAPPWTPLALCWNVRTGSVRSSRVSDMPPSRVDSDCCSSSWSSGYDPLASMPRRSGYSSLSNGGEKGTSTTSYEALYSHIMDSTQRMQPPSMPDSSRQILPNSFGYPPPMLVNTVPNWTTYYDDGLGSSLCRMRLVRVLRT
jgi:hypothetical protein